MTNERTTMLRLGVRQRRAAGLALTLAVIAAGCGGSKSGVSSDGATSGSGSTESSSPTDAPVTNAGSTQPTPPSAASVPPASVGETSTIEWTELSDGVEQAMIEVPLSYEDPSRGTIKLFVARHLASRPDERIGSLLVNPGGPGFGGTILATQAEYIYGSDLLDRFDIVGWDPRGTGHSEPALDCVEGPDPYFGIDSQPDDDAQLQALVDAGTAIADACKASNGDLLPYMSTADSAKDMDSIRRALGEDKISYFGFSYGSELGSVWATLFPATVRAAVLDGAADPNESALDSAFAQAVGFERSLQAFLADCSADTRCVFHSDGAAETAFAELADSIDSQPLAVGSRQVTSGTMATAVAEALYTQERWPQLASALVDAQAGNGAALLAMYDEYFQKNPDGSYGNEIEAMLGTVCVDDPGPTTVEAVKAEASRFEQAAPYFGDFLLYSFQCLHWPAPPVTAVEVTGAGAGPVVVVGTTGDPATPLESTRRMAAALEQGVLVVVDAEQHTAYGLNDCINGLVDDYLVRLKVPAADTTC